MSLFKVRDFWSFDLVQLRQSSDNSRSATPENQVGSSASPIDESIENGRTQFIVDIGRFSSIGEQDVFVCGHLEGHIYIVQVPEADQRKFIKVANDGAGGHDPAGSSGSSSDISQRQLLAAKSFDMLILDLKCGYFTSTLKQSIAVLSANKLLILTVRSNQIDLITGEGMFNSSQSSEAPPFETSLLLSHNFEVHTRLDLLVGELAFGLIVLNSHSDSCLVEPHGNSSGRRKSAKSSDSNSSSSQDSTRAESIAKQKIKQVVQQLRLPQRDRIVTQYVNQFVFTLIDNKKIVGHFRISAQIEPVSELQREVQLNRGEQRLDYLGECFGPMPMAHLMMRPNPAQSSLVLSLSDHFIYCLPIDKLTSQARQKVVNRVALDLISSKRASDAKADLSSVIEQRSDEASSDPLIQINLDSLCEWRHELTTLPIQMLGLRRQDASQTREIGQLLVMSRFSLNLFSSSGEQLWHQRFETPLIHLHAYTIANSSSDQQADSARQTTSGNSARVPSNEPAPSSSDASSTNQRGQMNDKLISLVCSASLRDDKTNLTILKDDRLSWSAALNSRPLQMWRLNLSRMSGLIAALDVRSGLLVVSYLGTNMKPGADDNDEGPSGEELSSMSDDTLENLVELERLNEPLFMETSWTSEQSKEDQQKRLQIANRIELGTSDGIVLVSTSIRQDPSSVCVLHNIKLTFEFDDLLEFELTNGNAPSQSVEHLASGVAELKLGNCWPDRRSAILVEASFSLPSASLSKLTGTAAIEQHDNQNIGRAYNNRSRMPKSLRVYQHLTFNETHSGLLRQESSFLLPISVVSRLLHLDYTSGGNQDLNDVLNNLTGYKRSNDQLNEKAPYHHCDLFLNLKSDLFIMLHELIEGDLICRGKLASAQSVLTNANPDAKNDEEATHEMKSVTLENLSLLAQSLDCRVRYMSPSPSGLNRQPSEELVQPTMLSVALALRDTFPHVVESKTKNDEHQPVVWIHICDLSKIEDPDNIIADFIATHMKYWKEFPNSEEADFSGGIGSNPYKSRILISIESLHPLAIVFVLDHLDARTERLSVAGSSVGTRLVPRNEHSQSPREFIDDNLREVSRLLAISSSLHEALLSVFNAYETHHKPKINQLRTDLTREFVGYRAVIEGSLSSAKRLSSLPDDLGSQLDDLMVQARDSHQRLTNGLDELERYGRRDVEFSKLPTATAIRLQPSKNSALISWPTFGRVSD